MIGIGCDFWLWIASISSGNICRASKVIAVTRESDRTLIRNYSRKRTFSLHPFWFLSLSLSLLFPFPTVKTIYSKYRTLKRRQGKWSGRREGNRDGRRWPKQETRKLKIKKSGGREIVDHHEESRNPLRVGGLLTSDGEVTDCRGKESFRLPLCSPHLAACSDRTVIQKHAIYIEVFISLYDHRAFILLYIVIEKSPRINKYCLFYENWSFASFVWCCYNFFSLLSLCIIR